MIRVLRLFSPKEDLLRILRVLVQVLQPETVLEIGVGAGFSFAAMLGELEHNGRGRLASVDLPMLNFDPRRIGSAIPGSLRHRWTLTRGPSRLVLGDVLRTLPSIDLFLHDGDRTHPVQAEDCRLVWPHVREGGILVMDDVCNPAFGEFAAEVAAQPFLVGQIDDGIGLLRKG